MIALIRENHPRQSADVSDAALVMETRRQTARAACHGLTDELSAATYVYAAWLLGVGEHALPFEKGAAACIAVRRGEIGEGSGVLEWFVTPAWCEPAGDVTSP